MKILVVGGTGNVGGGVVTELLKRGAQVRVLARKQPEAGKLPADVEVAVGDLLDPVSVETAMQGVDKLFLLNAVVTDELTQALIAYGVAKRIGLKHVTYLSVFKVDQFRDVPHFASKLAVENALREFGVPYTILRPGYYIQNDISLKEALDWFGCLSHANRHSRNSRCRYSRHRRSGCDLPDRRRARWPDVRHRRIFFNQRSGQRRIVEQTAW